MIATAIDPGVPADLPAMGHRRWLVAFGLVLAVGALLFVVSRPGQSPQGALPAAAPFSLPSLADDGSVVSLDALAGKPAVINFFASWCAPCRRELPALRESAEQFGNRVHFIGINHQDTGPDARALLDEFSITYPAGFDPKGETAFAYGLRGLPATVFITADGRIKTIRHGELTAATLEQEITGLLGASPTLQRTP
ncbi:MAG: TlpA family protein disulfide reductase [Acidimicrobiales bacterium]